MHPPQKKSSNFGPHFLPPGPGTSSSSFSSPSSSPVLLRSSYFPSPSTTWTTRTIPDTKTRPLHHRCCRTTNPSSCHFLPRCFLLRCPMCPFLWSRRRRTPWEGGVGPLVSLKPRASRRSRASSGARTAPESIARPRPSWSPRRSCPRRLHLQSEHRAADGNRGRGSNPETPGAALPPPSINPPVPTTPRYVFPPTFLRGGRWASRSCRRLRRSGPGPIGGARNGGPWPRRGGVGVRSRT
mmetsp:Transcript_39676/g.73120  ORF Transcript_39676/g.73120 Transcript_39676/m.73120 type:complete len:240 (-) Transcript_39676:122-841(-)